MVRVFAAESRAKACWRAGERDKAAQDYRRVIDISRKATPEERDLRVELTHPTRLSSSMVWGRVRSGVIIDRHARTAAENLTSIESGAVDYPELRIERDFDDDAFETLSGGEGLPTASSDDMSRTLMPREVWLHATTAGLGQSHDRDGVQLLRQTRGGQGAQDVPRV